MLRIAVILLPVLVTGSSVLFAADADFEAGAMAAQRAFALSNCPSLARTLKAIKKAPDRTDDADYEDGKRAAAKELTLTMREFGVPAVCRDIALVFFGTGSDKKN